MKTQIFISICILIHIFTINKVTAQFGIKGGPGISDIAFKLSGQTTYLGYEIDHIEHNIPLTTFQFGFSQNIPIGRKFNIQPELLFVRQGLNYDIAFLYEDITYRVKINYLRVPLIIYYRSAPDKKRHPGLFAGPYISFKLNAIRELSNEENFDENPVTNIHDIDFGMLGGICMDFDLPSGQLNLELRTSFSLVNMMDPIEGNLSWYYGPQSEYVRNVSITFLIGYRFSNLFKSKADQ